MPGGMSRRYLPAGHRRRRRDRHGARRARAAAQAAPYEKFTWISPRGTLEVLDDYPYWVGKKMGYFDGLRHRHAARPVGRHGDGEVRRCRPGRHGLPVARRVLLRARERHEAQVGVPHGRARHLQPRLPQGRGHQRPEGRSRARPSCSARPPGSRSSIRCWPRRASTSPRSSMSRPAGRPGARRWPAARAMRRCPGKACGPSGSPAASISNTGWACRTRRCRPTPSWCAPPTSRIPDKKAFLEKYLRGWAMGLEFGYHNPRAAVEAVFEQFPTLRQEHRAGARHHLDPAADQRLPRRHGQARGLGLRTTWRAGRPSSTRSTSSARSPSR